MSSNTHQANKPTNAKKTKCIYFVRPSKPISDIQVMHECWFENTLARLSALRIKKNLTETQVRMVSTLLRMKLMLKMKILMT